MFERLGQIVKQLNVKRIEKRVQRNDCSGYALSSNREVKIAT